MGIKRTVLASRFYFWMKKYNSFHVQLKKFKKYDDPIFSLYLDLNPFEKFIGLGGVLIDVRLSRFFQYILTRARTIGKNASHHFPQQKPNSETP